MVDLGNDAHAGLYGMVVSYQSALQSPHQNKNKERLVNKDKYDKYKPVHV